MRPARGVRQRPPPRLLTTFRPFAGDDPAPPGVRPAPNGRATQGKGPARIRAILTVTVALAAILLSTPTAATAGCNTRECHVRVLSKKCDNHRPRTCVEWIIARHQVGGWHAAWLRRIPGCESGWNPHARNPSGASGLYQFMPSTWATTPYARRSIWSARWQAAAARWMVVVAGRSREWVCR